MTEIRAGRYEDETQYAPLVPCDAEPVRLPCLFCGDEVWVGAFWMGSTGQIAVCNLCVQDGKLGMLIGDAVDASPMIERALLATERHAYRSRLMAIQRRRDTANERRWRAVG